MVLDLGESVVKGTNATLLSVSVLVFGVILSHPEVIKEEPFHAQFSV